MLGCDRASPRAAMSMGWLLMVLLLLLEGTPVMQCTAGTVERIFRAFFSLEACVLQSYFFCSTVLPMWAGTVTDSALL